MIEPEERHSSDSTIGTAGGHGPADHSINVVIRVRPIITGQPVTSKVTRDKDHVSKEKDATDADPSTAITFPAAGQIQVDDTIASTNRSFAFNVVFEPEASQEEVFEHSGVKRLIDMALDGFACTVFAYGQTSTGKTYTLTGNVFQTEPNRLESTSTMARRSHQIARVKEKASDRNSHESSPKNIGIVQLSFAYLFEQIKRRKLRDKTLYVITVSYLEVYNEQVLDLLNPSPRCLNVRWAKDRGFYAENLFKVECEDIGDLEGVLEEGCKNRQVRSHSMNENSSRSHAVMTITLFSEMPDPEDPQGFIRKEGRFCLVDLAGSEKTKRTNSKGGTFVEANNINRSLLVLGNCIACLADSKRRNGHIPYRDSTLTKLLADSLSGNGMTLMIACVSPLKCDSQETINTLRYACRAKRVRMNPVVQMVEDGASIGALDHSSLVSMLTNNDKLVVDREDDKDGQILSKYMRENEVLRVENVQLNLQRNRLIRDHELVCRENEKLLKKLHSVLSKADSGRKHSSIAVQLMPSLSSSASSPSLLSLVSQEEANLMSDNIGNHSMKVSARVASPKRLSSNRSQRYHSPKNALTDEEEIEEHNGLMFIKERPYNDQLDHVSIRSSQNIRRNSRNSRFIDEAKRSNIDQEQASTLDLTIRGKSAVNNGNRVQSIAKRRN